MWGDDRSRRPSQAVRLRAARQAATGFWGSMADHLTENAIIA
jgi:hypothetical protein